MLMSEQAVLSARDKGLVTIANPVAAGRTQSTFVGPNSLLQWSSLAQEAGSPPVAKNSPGPSIPLWALLVSIMSKILS